MGDVGALERGAMEPHRPSLKLPPSTEWLRRDRSARPGGSVRARGGLAGFQEQAARFGVYGDAGEAGQKAVSEQAGLAVEYGLFMKASGDVLKFV